MQQQSELKKTELVEIPKDWTVIKFGDFSKTYRYPTFYGIKYHADGIPVLNIGNIDNNSWRLSANPNDYQKIDEETSKKFGRTIVSEGDLVLAVRGATIGKFALVPKILAQSNINANLLKIRLNKLVCLPTFFWYYCQTNRAKHDFKGFVTYTAKETVQAGKLQLWNIALPSIKEQERIASILSNVDELIEKTDQIIEQTQRLKKGLMQRLLTKGFQYTNNKELLDKKVILDDLIDIKHGYAFKGQFFTDNPTRNILLTPGNFSIGGGFKGDKIIYYEGPVSEDFILSQEDLIVTMTDLSKMGDTLGYPAIVPSNTGFRYLHNQRLGKIIVKDYGRLDKLFLYYLLCSNEYRHGVLTSATGTTVRHTSPTRIKSFKFYLPPIKEQQKIASILSKVDELIKKQKTRKSKIENLKKGLMQKLLTGKIRVKM